MFSAQQRPVAASLCIFGWSEEVACSFHLDWAGFGGPIENSIFVGSMVFLKD